MNALILAAGKGERLQPYTSTLPKPAIPFLNLPMGFFCTDLFHDCQVKNMVINTHHLPEKIKSAFSSLKEDFPSLHFSFEKGLLGGGGTLKENLSLFQSPSPVLSLNSDSFLLYTSDGTPLSPAQQTLDFHKKNQATATLLLIEHSEAGKSLSAVWCDDSGRIHGFGKEAPQINTSLKPFHFVGLQVIEKNTISLLPDGFSNIINDLYKPMVQDANSSNLIQGFILPKAHWFETGNLKDYLSATEFVLEKLIEKEPFSIFETVLKKHFPDLQIQGNTVYTAPLQNQKTNSNYPLFIGRGVNIHPSVRFEGFAVIGDGVTLEKGTVIKNTVIGENVSIQENSILEETLIL